MVERLVAALNDNNPDVRWNALSALGRNIESRVIKPLIHIASHDDNIPIITLAVDTLMEVNDPQREKQLIDFRETICMIQNQ